MSLAIGSTSFRSHSNRWSYEPFIRIYPFVRACPPTSIYGDFHLVLCRNVLRYYRLEVRGGMLDKLHRCLVPGGYLVIGETERLIAAQAGGFHPVVPSVALF